jgi:hypothetical protein
LIVLAVLVPFRIRLPPDRSTGAVRLAANAVSVPAVTSSVVIEVRLATAIVPADVTVMPFVRIRTSSLGPGMPGLPA